MIWQQQHETQHDHVAELEPLNEPTAHAAHGISVQLIRLAQDIVAVKIYHLGLTLQTFLKTNIYPVYKIKPILFTKKYSSIIKFSIWYSMNLEFTSCPLEFFISLPPVKNMKGANWLVLFDGSENQFHN